MMKEILRVLEEDALASPEKISKMVGMEEGEVRDEIQRLEREGVILGYRAVVDDEKAERDVVKAVIEVRITPEREGGFNRLANRIAQYQEVTSCYLMSGGYDLLVMVEGKDLRKVAGFVSEKLSTLEGVISTSTHFLLKTYKEQGTLFVREGREERLKVSP